MVHFDVLYIFEWRQGPPNVARPGVTYPLTLFLMGLIMSTRQLQAPLTNLPK